MCLHTTRAAGNGIPFAAMSQRVARSRDIKTHSTDKYTDKRFSGNAMGLFLVGKDTATHQKSR